MPYIAGYLLKLSLSLSIVYLFYVIVLRRLTFYSWNRWYLLGYSFLAFLIPFVNISPVLQKSNWDDFTVIQLIPVFGNLNQMGSNEMADPGFINWVYLLLSMLAGILLMLVRFVVRYISYRRIRRSAELIADVGVKVYHVNKSIIPFSFGSNIFINRQLHPEEDLQQIIHHEFIHVKQKHTIDIMWAECLCMLNWYNPFAWLIRKAIRQNLEFIADQQVLQNGIDKKDYQYLLLKVTGAAHFSITQQFNFSSLKKRIIMMNRSRSARIQLTRFLFLLPLLVVLLLTFRSNIIAQNNVADTVATSTITVQQFAEKKLTEYFRRDTVPGKDRATVIHFLKKNPAINKLTWDNDRSGKTTLTVIRKDGTVENYNWNEKSARSLFEERYGFIPDLPAHAREKGYWQAAGVSDTVAVNASLDGPGNPYIRSLPTNILIVLDGVVQAEGYDAIRDLDPNTIQSMNVLKKESAIALYGDKAKDKEGVIIITTNKKPDDAIIIGKRSLIASDSTVFSGSPNIVFRNPNEQVPLYIVDGIELSPAEFAKSAVDPDRIESITVLKNGPATKIYGEKGKYGVIIIKLKKPLTQIEQSPETEDLRELIKDSEKLIWHVNGQSFAVTGAGSYGLMKGNISQVIIDNKFYNADEANRLFKRSQFSGVDALTADYVYKEYGVKAPAFRMTRH